MALSETATPRWHTFYDAPPKVKGVNTAASGRAQKLAKQEELRKKAKQIDNYIFKWILTNGTEVTLFQCPKKWLRVSVKHLQNEFTVPLLEPQKTEEQTKAAIQKVISRYPHVDEKNAHFPVSFKDQSKIKIIKQWALKGHQVSDFDDIDSFLFGLDSDGGELYLKEENHQLHWEFFAKGSRTLSVLKEPILNTFFFEIPNPGQSEEYRFSWYGKRYGYDQELFQKDLEHYKIKVLAASEPNPKITESVAYDTKGDLIFNNGKRATRITGVCLIPIHYQSALDPTQSISRTEWAVTLISMPPNPPKPPHAEILFEKITSDGHLFQLAHLGTTCDIYDAKHYCGKSGTPRVSSEKTFDEIDFDRRSPVWIRSAKKVQEQIQHIQIQELQKIIVPFHLLGKDSLIARLFHKGLCHNCTTWAKEQLAALDIQLPDKITDLFVTYPDRYTSKTNNLLQKEACNFIPSRKPWFVPHPDPYPSKTEQPITKGSM